MRADGGGEAESDGQELRSSGVEERGLADGSDGAAARRALSWRAGRAPSPLVTRWEGIPADAKKSPKSASKSGRAVSLKAPLNVLCVWPALCFVVRWSALPCCSQVQTERDKFEWRPAPLRSHQTAAVGPAT